MIQPAVTPLVEDVDKDTPAARAGVKPGDIITAVNGKPIFHVRNLIDEIEKHPKYSIINFATGIELMLKARLMWEHWSLVVEKTGDAVLKDFQEGKAKTVTPREAMKRLREP